MNAVAVTFLTLVVAIGPRTDAQQQSAIVSTIASETTDTFTDAATKGRPESDFKDKWIRFITPSHPDGFVTRVKSFDPATGRFTLYDQIPAGAVKQNDVYQLASSPDSLAALGLVRPAADVACAPAGTSAADQIACTGADTTGVTALGGNDDVDVQAGASVDVSAAGIRSPESTAVSGGDGRDTVTNSGAVSASATAVFTPVLTPPSPVPGISKVWAAAIAASPDAKAIDGGAGNDTITNASTGSAAASATSVILPSIVNGTAEGLSKADVSSTSKATATAVAGGDGADTLTNDGTLDPSATATALGVNLVMTSVVEAGKGGKSTVKGDVKAESTTAGLSGGAGNDTVVNNAAFGTTSTAASIAAAASTLDAKGSVAASAKATGESTATAIDLGAGSDTLTNAGSVTATANATAHAVNVGIAENNPPPTDKKEKVKAVADGGASATANAIGIGADSQATSTEIDPELLNDGERRGLTFGLTKAYASGNDDVTNSASVGVTANAQSGAAGVTAGMSIDGSATAKTTSTAEANAAAVDLGGGNDKLTNTSAGLLTAVASATANGVNAAIVAKSEPSKKGEIESTADGSVKAESHATGLAADSVRPDVTYSGTLTAGDGFRLQISETKTRASGTDDVINSGAVSGTAVSTAQALGVGVAFDGKTSAKMSSSAEANAGGVDLGGGNDSLLNNATGQLTADASATAKGLNVAVGIKTDDSDKSKAESTVEGSVKASSNATGLGADSLVPDRTREGTLTLGGGALGIHIKEVETRAAGTDTVTNDGAVTAGAASTTEAGGVGIAIDGKTAAKIDSKAEADAAAIDLGGGKDSLTNNATGQLTATATATATGVNAAIGVKTDPSAKGDAEAAAEGSVEAASRATGIGADGLAGDKTREATLTVSLDRLSITASESVTRASGDDTVTNHGASTATASSTTIAGGVGIAINGEAAAKITSEARTDAAGIDLGGGADKLTNSGTLTAGATSTAAALNVAIAVPSESAKPEGSKLKAAAEGSATAESHAAGLTADSAAGDTTRSAEVTFDAGGLFVEYRKTETRAGGNDDVTNTGAATATATANSGAAGIAGGTAVDGSATAKITSTAEAQAAGIDLGGGNDKLTNTATGQLAAASTATALGLNAAVVAKSDPSKKGEIESTAEGSVKAESHATGLAADSGRADVEQSGTLVAGDFLELQVSEKKTRAGGNDDVTNSGVVTGIAHSTAGAIGGSVAFDGKATAKMSSSAEANAAGVDLGGGHDTLTNNVTGQLTATATATARGLNVSLGAKTDTSEKTEAESTVEGSVEATANATGLGADSLAADRTREAMLVLDSAGLLLAAREVETRAAGHDTVTNHGVASATANASTEAGGLGLAVDGKAAAKIESKAEAAAGAVDLGGGNDSLTNTATAQLTANATANAVGVNAAIGVKSDPSAKGEVESAAEGSVEAKSRATGIGADSLAGDKTREATLIIDGSGLLLTASESETRASGNDVVTNDGAVSATATSATLAGGVGITINGEASAKITSEAEADAAAIDLGGGNDKATNSGTLTSDATSTAVTLNVAVGVSGENSSAKPGESKSKTAADGSATAESRATGLAADSTAGDTARGAEISIGAGGLRLDYGKTESRASGNDDVTNTGAITATSSANSGAVGVGVTVKGAASANSKSTAESTAIGIDLGGGEDVLTNSGTVVATASSLSGAVKVAVSTEGRATTSDGLWQGGIKSEATATGIDAGGVNTESTSASIVIDGTGIHGRYEKIEDSTGPAGRDVVTNTGNIRAGANAASGSANVSVTSEGLAAAISHAEAEANATGIASGNGNDDLENLGPGSVVVASIAESGGLKVVASGKGTAVAADALWDGGIKSEATAIGINSDAGELEKMLVTASIDGNGLLLEHEKSTIVSSGNDTILNEQAVGVTATASAPALNVALEAKKGIAAAISKVSSEAEAAAIRAGGGNDDITNRGALTSAANVTAETANFSIAKEGLAAATDSVWDGGTKAEATALGIDADGPGNESKKTTLTLNGSGVTILNTDTKESATGNDIVLNEARIDANASATARSLAVALTAKGLSAALSQSTAEAESAAIRGGGGHDDITNRGILTSTATSNAQAASVAVTVEKGVSAAGNAVWDGGITADATAVGIEGDGGDGKTTKTLTLKTGGGGDIDKGETKEEASGNDTILNTGAITATASATAPEVSVSISTKGVAAAISTSTAKSSATAIDGGAGDDEVSNTGKLTADATSLAVAVNVGAVDKGLSIAANNSWDGGVKADARARGIDGGAGFDSLGNNAEVSARSTATAPSVGVAIAATGVPIAVSTATATSDATAIDAGGGTEADQIANLIGGKLTSHAEAFAIAANVAVTNQGLAVAADAVWDGGTKSEATARGIDAGQGADTVTNAGEIGATSVANVVSASIAVTNTGLAAATATSTATSNAAALHTGDGQDADVVNNLGRLLAQSNAFAASASVAVTNTGASAAVGAVWDGGTKADAFATGIATGAGDDIVTNAALVEARSDAKTAEVAASVTVTGVAAASATSTGTSIASAIDTGAAGGADKITNAGKLIAVADALAVAASVSVTNAGLAVASGAVWDGGTLADAIARGIRAGLGADAITNTADIEADATAWTGSVAAGISVTGVAGAIATSTGRAHATAIDSGDEKETGAGVDADEIVNTGRLAADASVLAGTVTVGVTTAGVSIAGDAAWDGGTKAEAVAKGIAAGAGADKVQNDGEITATSDGKTASVNVSVAVTGAAGAVGTSTGTASATAIDTGDGADTILNTNAGLPNRTGTLTADASALALAANVSITTAGVAVAADSVWDGGTKAEATAKGIDAGLGTDTVTNASDIRATSSAETVSVAGSVAITGVAGAIASATGRSSSTAIDAGSGLGGDTIFNTGVLRATAETLAVSAAIGFTTAGLAVAGNPVWDGGVLGEAIAQGIAGSHGADTLRNARLIETIADSDSVGVSGSVAVAGVAGAVSTATSKGQSTAIDGGAGNDVIQNLATGELRTNADAYALAVNVGFTLTGVTAVADSVWTGGTTAEATAKGIHGGAGLDTITNEALVTTSAVSSTGSVNIAVTGIGAGGAITAATSTANATAIDGGGDADVITNRANLTATADATGTGVAVTVTGIGASVAGDAFWDGGTKANANATGIAGGSGDDTVGNTANKITADATSRTTSVAVSVTGIGLAGVAAASTSTARATAIDGQDGLDTIVNEQALESKATSTASGVGVAVSLAGGAGSGSFVDNVTKAEAIATGIAGGAGADTITSALPASIALTSGAASTDTNVSVTLVGVADGNSQALTIARAIGIDGGSGHDTLTNVGSITGNLTADLRARSIGVTLGGASGNASGIAETVGTGIEGGTDNDTVSNNGQIALTSTSTASGQTVNVGVTGGTLGDASGTGRATLVGLAGGAGNDTLTNNGGITLLPTTRAFGQNVGVSVTGASVNDASARSFATAVGLDGGAGDDIIVNNKAIAAIVSGSTTARSTGVVVGGSALNKSNSASEAAAIGIDGGDQADRILNANTGTLDVRANATTTANSVSVGVAGSTGSEALIRPFATATGLEGGAGNDEVTNEGTALVRAAATGTSNNSTTQIFGSAGANAGATTDATALGIGGGAGNDVLLNRRLLDVGATSSATVSGSSWSLAGGAAGNSALTAGGGATGMAGGTGSDVLSNQGTVIVNAGSTLDATGGSSAIFGGAGSNTQLAAAVTATGLSGGDGTNTIENLENLDVNSTATVRSNKSSVSFAGSPSTDALLAARATSTGVAGGVDADVVTNDGAVSVDAKADTNVQGLTSADLGGNTTSTGFASATVTARGVDAGAGNNTLTNTNVVDVEGITDASVNNSSSAGFFFSDGNTRSNTRATVNAAGLTAGAGNDVITNTRDVRVSTLAGAHGFAYAVGGSFSIEGDANARSEVTVGATASGISAGDGVNRVTNDGLLSVLAFATTSRVVTTVSTVCTERRVPQPPTCTPILDEDGNQVGETCTPNPDVIEKTCTDETVVPRDEVTGTPLGATPTYAGANGNGASGDGLAVATGTATAVANGIEVGNGTNTILNLNGDVIEVTANPDARVTTFADGDAFGDATGISTATANATAVGIRAGHGNNAIGNEGAITVSAAPTAQARVAVSGGDICIWYLFGTWCGGGGDGEGDARAFFSADARGIVTGDGNNQIVNEGSITVTAAPAVAGGFTTFVDGDGGPEFDTSVTSRAIGIQTGNGSNQILNGGTIAVEARDAQIDYSCTRASCTPSLTAIGIQTGSGNDLIVNDGTISTALVARNGTITRGIAIDSGAGDDEVTLGVGSSTTGAVLLGAGNDTLVWSADAALTGSADGSTGTDTFALGGSADADFDPSAIGSIFTNFELFEKRGTSRWTLFGNHRMNWTVTEGTLAIAGTITGTIDTSLRARSPEIAVLPTGTIRRDDLVAPAVLLRGGATLTNDGLIESTAGGGLAVLASGSGNHIMNRGSIRSAGPAIDLSGDGNALVNSGSLSTTSLTATTVTLAGRNNTLLNNGVISGIAEAVRAGGNVTITNGPLGTVVAEGAGITVSGNGSVVNDGRIGAFGPNGNGVLLSGSGGSVINRGLIGGRAAALRFDSAPGSIGSLVNDVGGSIDGTAAAILGGGGNESVTNHGRIFGASGLAIDLGGGQDMLLITASSDISGITRGGDGSDTFVLTGAQNASFNLSNIGPVIQGFERFRKQGSSTWTLFGQAASDWTVDEATLVVQGAVAGTVDTNAAAANAFVNVQSTGSIRRDDGLSAVILNGSATLSNAGSVLTSTGTNAAVQALGIGNQITNTGEISSTGSGILINGQGNLLNNQGRIGGSLGVQALGNSNQITNSGDIISSGLGLQISGQGNVLNNRGSVRAVGGAIALAGGDNSFFNNGFIQAGSGGAAVQAAGNTNQITNSGEIRSSGTGFDISGNNNLLNNDGITSSVGGAVSFNGGVNSFVNRGFVEATGTGAAVNAVGDGNLFSNRGEVRSGGIGVQLTGSGNQFDNLGTVRAFGSGVAFIGGNSAISNFGLIDIAGPGTGLSAAGNSNRITNSGELRSAGIGVQMTGGGNLFSNLGTTRGATGGIVMAGGNNSISNVGLIDVTAGNGLQTDGDGNQLTNGGSVRAGGTGLQMTGQGNVLDNAGTVLAGGAAAVLMSGNGNSVTNSGLISGSGAGLQILGGASSFVNNGEVSSGGAGVLFSGAGNALQNNGVIRGNGFGVRTDGAGTTFVNRGSVIAQGIGVSMAGTGLSLTNQNLISAGGTAVQIQSAAGSATTVRNDAGAIIQSSGGLAIAGGDGNERIENLGTLVGGGGTSVDLGGGNDVLHLTTSALIGGTARGGSGIDTLELAGPGAVRTDLGSYVDFETLDKQGTGTWFLTGAADMGWTVNDGQLVVEGRLAGPGLLTAAGRLGGAGIVGGFVNQGTVAPGNSIGTLTVLGNYEHAAGAVLEIEGAINGESDKLLVNGRAQLNGGRVAVTPESRTYGIATEYTILNATGGVSGTFGSASSSQSHLDPYLDYGAQNVMLTLVRNDISFRQMGSTPNIQLLGSALDANKRAMARGDFKLVMDQFVFMDEQQRRTALDSLSGELHATIARTILQTGNRFFAAAVDRQLSAEQIEDKRRTVWTDAFGFTGSIDSDINASGASYRAAGFAAGMDFMVTRAIRIGGAFGYAPGTTELSRFGGGEGQIRSYYPSLYGEHDAGRWSLGLGFGYGRHDVSTTRGIEVGPIARQATANYTADQYSGQAAGAFSLHSTDTVSVDAFGELRYSRLTRDSFDESGANSANLLDVSDGHSESLRSVLGMRTTWQPRAWSARVKPELRIGWARESLDYRGEFTATLDGATSLAGFQRFFVQGVTEARDSAIVSLGATTTFIKRGRMFFAYDGNFSSRGTEHGLGAGVRISW